jgi:bacterioferritin (cytochrome b1)
MRKSINWAKDRGFLLSTLIILVFFDNFFRFLSWANGLGIKKPHSEESEQGFKHEKNLLRRILQSQQWPDIQRAMLIKAFGKGNG